ncbi:MAG: hypothetical protein Kow0032_10630 [Methyloligellaceae bacterium]
MALWKKIALGVVATIVIAVGLALYYTAGMVEPIERQLAAIKADDLDAAYAETSVAFRKATSKLQFAVFVKSNPAFRDVVGHSFTERKRENNVGTVKGMLKTAEGGVFPVEYRLVQENGEWKILGIKIAGR